MSSSLTFLLITSRMRCVPASGAKVRPLMPTLLISSSSESLSPYARRLATPSLTLRRLSSGTSSLISGSMHDTSAVLSAVRLVSPKPPASIPFSTASMIAFGERSRTGR